jgi:hypothetical protein
MILVAGSSDFSTGTSRKMVGFESGNTMPESSGWLCLGSLRKQKKTVTVFLLPYASIWEDNNYFSVFDQIYFLKILDYQNESFQILISIME